jgi:hypothetical protein
MSRNEKHNMAHSVFQRLLNQAKTREIDFNLLLSRYGMERFIYRLSISPYNENFILKGASLFLVWKGQDYRVTRDADFLGFGEASPRQLLEQFQLICRQDCPTDDGMEFIPDTVKAQAIREEQEYDGVRVTLMGKLGNARIPLQIDIGFGDAITPQPDEIEYPTLLDNPAPHLKAYPRYTLVSEKFEAMVRLGIANSRMKDFFDIWLLTQMFEFEGSLLARAISNTFERRGTSLPKERPLAFTSDFYEDAQKIVQWNAFVRKANPCLEVGDLQDIAKATSVFIMPIIESIQFANVFKKTWMPNRGWT